MKIIKKFLALLFLLTLLVLPYFVFAADEDSSAAKIIGTPLDNLQKVGSESGPYAAASSFTLTTAIGSIIKVFLSLLGVIFVGLMVYAGYNWMIARGEEEKVTIAKDTIKRAIIGLIITVGSYAIWNFIYNYLIR
jgi:cytochrome bd-type quinol oxidase subunit 2